MGCDLHLLIQWPDNIYVHSIGLHQIKGRSMRVDITYTIGLKDTFCSCVCYLCEYNFINRTKNACQKTEWG